MSIKLFGWGPAFGLRGPSPYVMKCDIQLQMLGVEFERCLADLESVSKHKAPYVWDGGTLIQDSTFIRFHFEKKLRKDLDAGMSSTERGASWSLQTMLESRLGLIIGQERWLESDNFERGPYHFFAAIPEPARAGVCEQVRADLRAMLVRQGLGRHSREERMVLAGHDIAAVSNLLGRQAFLFGDRPTSADATAFGLIASAGTSFFDSPLPQLVDAHPNLRPYLTRMDELFFSRVAWPQAA